MDLGSPRGREAGLRRPVVVVTAQEILDESASVIQVVPLTSTMRGFGSEVAVPADDHNGLGADSAAHANTSERFRWTELKWSRETSVPPLSEIRGVLGLMLDIN
jgi:mRNA interferase MazF